MTNDIATRYGSWALITGSSSGIGAEFARQLASEGLNLVLTARRAAKLEELARNLRREYGVEVKVVPVDLAEDNFLDTLRQTTDSLDLGLVVSNAGAGAAGALITRSVSDVDWLLRLNVRAPTIIANHYGKQLARRGRGGLILVSSTIAHQSTPMMGEYGATKAHQLYLGEALSGELKQHGVDVTVLSPGPTRTDMVTSMDEMDFSKVPMLWMDSDAVVRDGLRALGRKRSVVAGKLNSVFAWFGRHFPAIAAAMFGTMMSKALTPESIAGIGASVKPARLAA